MQRAFVLHRKAYTESSLILELFTKEYGKITLIAKGARRAKSKVKGILQSFVPLTVGWTGKGNVKTLTQAEAISLALPLTGKNLYCAMYLNELLVRVLMPSVAMPQLFHDYLLSLAELAQDKDPEPALRSFELSLLSSLGYGIDFLHCAGSGEPISPTMTYLFREQQGFIASVQKNHLSFVGDELLAISERRFNTKAQLQAAKRFTQIALKPYLQGKPIKSRELFLQMPIT